LVNSLIVFVSSWAYFICDEAHRLKNSEGQMHKEMREAQAGNKLLVTGTPLQNNLRELWAILNFLHPEKFQDCDDFEERHRFVIEEAEVLFVYECSQ
jgi:chromodomain-helicase-DNA-binding protein 1